MVQYYCSLFVSAYKITIEWKWFLCANIVYQSTLVVAGKKKVVLTVAHFCAALHVSVLSFLLKKS